VSSMGGREGYCVGIDELANDWRCDDDQSDHLAVDESTEETADIDEVCAR